MNLSVCSVSAAVLMNIRKHWCTGLAVWTCGVWQRLVRPVHVIQLPVLGQLGWALAVSRRRAVLSHHVSCLFSARFLYLSNIFQHTILSSFYYFLALVHLLLAFCLAHHKSSWGDYWRIFHKKLFGLLMEYSGFSSSDAKLTAFVA